MKTRFVTAEECEKNRRWLHVDASGRVLGRMATRVAMALMGKDRPDWTPNVDTGAYVVVTNAADIKLTGKKMKTKTYERYSGYPGGRKVIPISRMLAKHPERVVRESVRRMLPKTKLGRKMLRKLKVYTGPDHPHGAHRPEELAI